MFDKDLFCSICEKYNVELSEKFDRPMIRDKVGVHKIEKEEVEYNLFYRGNRLECGFIEDKICNPELRKQVDNVIKTFGGKRARMKPLIYFDEFESHNDTVEVKKEVLNKIFNEVYQAGYEDGKRDNNLTYAYRDITDRYAYVPTVTTTTAELNMNK